MSSRILTQAGATGIAPLVWRQAQDQPPRPASPPVGFQPATNIASGEVAHLLNRIASLEHEARIQNADAYQKGETEGEARGRVEAEAALQPVLDRMAQTTRDLCGLRSRLRREAESDVVQLAIAIARRIIHRELSIDPAAMQALVQVALGRLDRQEIHRVWVHPSQAAAVKLKLGTENPQVEVIPDPNRELGSLLFETNRGKLDASVNAQFEEIERGLTDRVNQR